MATERELKRRIRTVKNTSQITSALAAISASKANRAQSRVQATREYASKAFEILNNLAESSASAVHPLLTVRENIKHVAVIMISGDRGLAGPYNNDIVRLVERFTAAMEPTVESIKFVTVGRKGRDLLIRRGFEIIASFENLTDPPTILEATPIAQVVVDDYLAGSLDQVFIAYTDFVNMVVRYQVIKQLLPLKVGNIDDMPGGEYIKVTKPNGNGNSSTDYTYEPAAEQLLDTIVPRFVDLQIYQSLLESLASEHSARYVAMNNATDNAKGLIEDLTLMRNKARQSAITSEILDIVGGAEALSE